MRKSPVVLFLSLGLAACATVPSAPMASSSASASASVPESAPAVAHTVPPLGDGPADIVAPPAGKVLITPAQAVQRAAAAGPDQPVSGVFGMTVQAHGMERGRLFLNSEADYRNPLNLSIVLLPAAQVGLQ